MKFNIIKTIICIALSLCLNNNCFANIIIFNNDTLSVKTKVIVSKLDSISKDSVIDLSSNSVKFNTFVALVNTASQAELLYLIKKHPNNAIKGYAYVGLIVLENKQADAVLPKYYKQLRIKVADTEGICYTSKTFMASIHKKKYRIQWAIQNKKAHILTDEEKKSNYNGK